MADQCDIGLIGLAVMGQNLILNMADHGFSVAAYNRTTSRVDEFIAGPARGKLVVGTHSPQQFVASLKRPRRILMMVKAGDPVQAVIDQLAPLLDQGDILIDGGNSFFADTERRIRELESSGLLYLGTGISGGEEGAHHGPSIMPGGSTEAWPDVKRIFQTIAAHVGPNNAIPCCEWIGSGGSGHYVKMVHNGIEYGDMQLICEAYSLLEHGLGLTNDELYDVFAEWNTGELDSYLIEITRDIFSVNDPTTGQALIEVILDKAGQKGTGQWTAQQALELRVPTTLVTEAVFARSLSAQKESRVRASEILSGPSGAIERFRDSANRQGFIDSVRRALYASKICSYAQGFIQLRGAAKEYNWDLNYGKIAMLWRGGCIIRAVFLESISDAYKRDPRLESLLLDPYFREAVESSQAAWRDVVATAAQLGISIPAFGAGLSYFDAYRTARLPQNLLQAQRDYFGAHTYERTDKPGSFHTDWVALRRPPT